jgi:hypothetical protein
VGQRFLDPVSSLHAYRMIVARRVLRRLRRNPAHFFGNRDVAPVLAFGFVNLQ